MLTSFSPVSPAARPGGSGSLYSTPGQTFINPQAAVEITSGEVFHLLMNLRNYADRIISDLQLQMSIQTSVDESGRPTSNPVYLAPALPSFLDDVPSPPSDFFIPVDEFEKVDPIELVDIPIPAQMEITVTLLDAIIAKVGGELAGETSAVEEAGLLRAVGRVDERRAELMSETSRYFLVRGSALPDACRAAAVARIGRAFDQNLVDIQAHVTMQREARRTFIMEKAAQVEELIRNALKALVLAKAEINRDRVAIFAARVDQYVAQVAGSAAKTDAFATAKIAEMRTYEAQVKGWTAVIEGKEAWALSSIESAKAAADTAIMVLEAQVAAYGAILGLRSERAKGYMTILAQVASAALAALNLSGNVTAHASLSENENFSTSESRESSQRITRGYSHSEHSSFSDNYSSSESQSRSFSRRFSQSYNYNFSES